MLKTEQISIIFTLYKRIKNYCYIGLISVFSLKSNYLILQKDNMYFILQGKNKKC